MKRLARVFFLIALCVSFVGNSFAVTKCPGEPVYASWSSSACSVTTITGATGVCSFSTGGSTSGSSVYIGSAPSSGSCSATIVCTSPSGGSSSDTVTVASCSCGGSVPSNASTWGNDSGFTYGSVPSYSHSASNTGAKCTFACNSGYSWNGSSCVAIPANCNVAPFGTVNHGSSVTAYQSSSPTGSCVSETRTCTNGTLSGSYTNSSCAAGCSSPSGNITSGTSVTSYQTSSVPYGSSCTSQTRTCTNGTLSGTYGNSSCTVDPPSNCNVAPFGTVNHGSSVTAYQTPSVPFGNSCISQTRTCTNGSLSGSYGYDSCSVDPPTGVNGSCSASLDSCFSGTFHDLSDNSSNYRWMCDGVSPGVDSGVCTYPKSYTITFNGNGSTGGSTASQVVNANSGTNLSTNGYTRTGYTFSGWATSAVGSVSYGNGAWYVIGTTDVTLYAVWTAAGSAPATPTGFVVGASTCGNYWLNISWNSSSGADSYDVYKDGSFLLNTTSVAFSDSNASGSYHSYYVIAKNSFGSSGQTATQGDTVSSACPVDPTITSPTATGISTSGATLGGNFVSAGSKTVTERGTCWGASPSPVTNCLAEGSTATGVFSHARSGMSAATTYYYRAYVRDNTGIYYYSSDSTFTTTAPAAPTGTISVDSYSCVVPTGSATCSVNLTWSTTNPVTTSQVTANQPTAGTVIRNANSDTNYSVSVNPSWSGGVRYFLYNNSVELANTSPAVTATCAGRGYDTDSNTCRDPSVGSVTIVGNYYDNPADLVVTCNNSNAYEVTRGGTFVSGGAYPSTRHIPVTVAGNYSVVCKYGTVDSLPALIFYYTAPPAATVTLNATPRTITKDGSSILNWETKFPTNTCTLTAKVVCTNNLCTSDQNAWQTTISDRLATGNTDANDPNTQRSITTAVTTPAPGHKDVDWKGFGKKTITGIPFTTDFTLKCPTGQTETKRVQVTTSQEG